MPGIPTLSSFDPELRVVQYLATRQRDAERGPRIWLNPADAARRSVVNGELVWVRGARGQQVAHLVVDDTVAEHTCRLRDIPGVDLAEAVRVSKPDLDTPKRFLA